MGVDYIRNKFGVLDRIFYLKVAFFLFSFIEIVGEFYNNDSVISFSKPFLMPILVVLYWLLSKVKSTLYIVALVVNWLANLFFISKDFHFVFIASLLFMFHRILIVVKIYKDVKAPSLFPVVVGALPFLFLFLSLINMVYDSMDNNSLIMSICQSVFMTLMGGIALGNYILKNDECSKLLLISSLFFAINLFVLGVKFYYLDFDFLKPISMGFFVIGQFVLCQFVVLSEKAQFLSINEKK